MFENICQQRDYITAHGIANLSDGIENTTKRGMRPAKYIGLFALKIIIYSKFTMCNLIITKSMIRSPGDEEGKINRINILKNRREDDDLNRLLFPYNSSGQRLNESITYRGEHEFVDRNSNKNVTLNTVITNDKDNVSNLSDFLKNSDINFKKYPNKSNDFLNYNVSGNNGTYESDNDNNTHDSVDHSVDGSGSVERKESVSQERVRQQRSSLSGFNNKYWDDLRSVSYSYLQNSHSAAVSGAPADVGPTGDDVWEPLITLYYCLWSGQFMRCLRENLIVPLHKYADEELLLDLTVGSDSDEAIDNGTSDNIDMSEGKGMRL